VIFYSNFYIFFSKRHIWLNSLENIRARNERARTQPNHPLLIVRQYYPCLLDQARHAWLLRSWHIFKAGTWRWMDCGTLCLKIEYPLLLIAFINCLRSTVHVFFIPFVFFAVAQLNRVLVGIVNGLKGKSWAEGLKGKPNWIGYWLEL
jgi:hypothetical protein